jgi:hypothetical protein
LPGGPRANYRPGRQRVGFRIARHSTAIRNLDEDKQAALLKEIANSDWDRDDVEPLLDATELYMPKSSRSFHETHRQTWEQFCFDVRNDPQTAKPFDEFIREELAESEERLPLGTLLFRARPEFKLDENDKRRP